jgi:arsenate reductase (thioredoxin)
MTDADEFDLLASDTVLDRAGAELAARFAGVFSPETVQECLTESYRLLEKSATVTAHLPVLAIHFATDRLRAAARAKGAIVSQIPEVLFVCVHNAGRSQIAAALLDHHAGGLVHVRSAGSAPAESINPAVIQAMDELGIDMSKEFPKPLTTEAVRGSDVIITMGCGDACPIFPGKRYLDWDLPDPAGKPLDQIRPIRDEIDRRVQKLVAELTTSAG